MCATVKRQLSTGLECWSDMSRYAASAQRSQSLASPIWQSQPQNMHTWDTDCHVALVFKQSRGTAPAKNGFKHNRLRVSGTTKMPQVDQRICHQLHAIVPLLDELEPQQQPFEFILPREGPLHA